MKSPNKSVSVPEEFAPFKRALSIINLNKRIEANRKVKSAIKQHKDAALLTKSKKQLKENTKE
jgi:hypothetical protein